MKHCLIITTGGTIDKDPSIPNEATALKCSLVPEALKKLGLDDQCEVVEWKAMQSRDLTDRDIALFARMAQESQYDHVIITQGTDFMAENSRKLAKEMGVTHKRIVVTGALKPLAEKGSDGFANLKAAVTEISQQPPGVHVVMNEGKWLKPEGLRKVHSGIIHFKKEFRNVEERSWTKTVHDLFTTRPAETKVSPGR